MDNVKMKRNNLKNSGQDNLFRLAGSPDYASVIFREPDTAAALATAAKARARMYRWDVKTLCWNLVYMPWNTDALPDGCRESSGECPAGPCGRRCRLDCLFEKTDAYYYSGAGTIVLPERIVTNRCSLFDDKELPDCPLHEYDIYSVADYREMEEMLHDMPPYSPEEQEAGEEEFSFGEDPKFHRVYTYLPYSHWRLKEILHNYFNAHMVCIRGYKEGRYQPGYKQRYNIYLNGSDYLLAKNIHLDSLRCVFAERGFPLHEIEPVRNQGAKEFLDTIYRLINLQNS